ncbi:MAG TPA: amidohydrolase family protein [Rhodopila sp.]
MVTATGCACCDVGVLGRRGLLTGASALGAAGLFGSASAAGKPFRIDVHHHIAPPAWVAALKGAKLDTPPVINWRPEQSIEDMDKGGVATAITSPTLPQVSFLSAADAARVARESNEYARKLADDHPGRFGVFAMLPMPHIDESLKELAYALDTLHADGIGMMTDYGNKWLGYPEFQPVFDDLNRRKAVVYTHPTTPNCCVNLARDVPDVAVEFGADTTRTIVNLIFSGTSQRYQDISFIFSHGGGVLTAVAERLQIQIERMPPYKGKFTPDQVQHELNRFFYDTAQVANSVTIEALAKLVPTTQIVFGSDYPYRSSAETAAGLDQRFKGKVLREIGRDNVARLLPAVRKM